jgi:SAM-dependent methyltransferase
MTRKPTKGSQAARERAGALLLPVAVAVPVLRRRAWRAFYQLLAVAEPDAFALMNYGFHGPAVPPVPPLDAALEAERCAYQLYHRVAAAVDLAGREVLDIGCGRGGGTAYLARMLGAGQVVGLDLAPAAVRRCRRRYPDADLRFQTGDALALPFPDASFDAVINVESAFCYPSRARFYAEVRRVLRDGGHFLYADIFDRRRVRAFEAALGRAGFVIESGASINDGVIAACDRDAGRRRALVDRLCGSRTTRAIAYNFVALPDSFIYRRLASGRRQYRVYRLRANEARDGH